MKGPSHVLPELSVAFVGQHDNMDNGKALAGTTGPARGGPRRRRLPGGPLGRAPVGLHPTAVSHLAQSPPKDRSPRSEGLVGWGTRAS